jgi:hypothetical protein
MKITKKIYIHAVADETVKNDNSIYISSYALSGAWVVLEERAIEIEINPKEFIPAQVAKLRSEINQTYAAAETRVVELNTAINRLLCLENNSEPSL